MRVVLITAFFAASLFGQHRGAPAPPARVTRPAPPPSNPIRPYAPVRPYAPRTTIVPVYVPYGYYAGPGYYDSGAPAPAAVVNQDFRPDGGTQTIVDYSNIPLPQAVDTDSNNTGATELKDDEPTIFLIALTDHTVVAAIAYWVDGDTLNWVSRDAKVNSMSVSLVDRTFSKQLNDERHVAFKLPPVH